MAEPTGGKAISKRILVTGEAGFVGSNLANNLLTDGFDGTIFDALVRAGSQENLAWLRQRSNRLHFVRGDARDIEAIKDVVADIDVIYHLAGQVAVTSSVNDPRSDFETNAIGTLLFVDEPYAGVPVGDFSELSV